MFLFKIALSIFTLLYVTHYPIIDVLFSLLIIITMIALLIIIIILLKFILK